MHGRGSLRALGTALNDPDLDERRFRSNVVLDGLVPWEEFGWAGRAIGVGGVTFDVMHPATRFLATHASPTVGVRDREVMTTLVREFQQSAPSFAVMMLPRTGGSIRIGDEVTVVED
ncbi:MAG: MOSC domain-containing protein [Dehalococcoidia bacterium]|nr:MOSC domain-containing protein [Dehalococcoidia bacterium]